MKVILFFKQSDFSSSLEKYTSAINIIESYRISSDSETDKYDDIMQLLHPLYSNRSACYFGLNRFDEALKDAKECIKLNPSWPKGYSRKGAALRAKGLFQAASESYKLAAQFEGSGKLAGEYQANSLECEKEDRYVRGIEQRPPSGSTSSNTDNSSSYSSSESYPSSALQFCFGSKQRFFHTFLFILRLVSFACLPFVIIPVFEFSQDCYQVSIVSTMVNFVFQLFFTYGRPRFDTMWLAQFLQDWRFSRFMIGMLFVLMPPSVVPLLVLLITELGHIAEYSHNLFMFIFPSISARMRHFARNSGTIAQFCNTTIDDWSSLDGATSWARYNRAVLVNGGRLEVVLVVTSFFGVVLQQLSVLTLFVLFQLMKVRYMISQETKDAFGELDLRILSFVSQYPTFMGIYLKIKGFLASQVETQQQQQDPSQNEGGFASRMRSQCTIM